MSSAWTHAAPNLSAGRRPRLSGCRDGALDCLVLFP